MAKIRAKHTGIVRAIAQQLNDIETLEELQALSESISGRWNQIQAKQQEQFKIGDPIEWHSNSRRYPGWHRGVVTGFKGVSLTAVTDRGVNWTVSPSVVQRSRIILED